MSPYQYAHPHPAVTTDIVIFSLREDAVQVLLIRRRGEPFRGAWALPGGFVEIDEPLEDCALRELREETGLEGLFLEQLYTFGAPGRDPRERVITVAYFALLRGDGPAPRAASDAEALAWFPLDALPQLAFDHGHIIGVARERLVAKLEYSTIALQLMPEKFTLGELQRAYELITGAPMDKRNFRRRVLATGCLRDTGERRRNGNHRPARLYAPRDPGSVRILR